LQGPASPVTPDDVGPGVVSPTCGTDKGVRIE
jgi:hypothetical protein